MGRRTIKPVNADYIDHTDGERGVYRFTGSLGNAFPEGTDPTAVMVGRCPVIFFRGEKGANSTVYRVTSLGDGGKGPTEIRALTEKGSARMLTAAIKTLNGYLDRVKTSIDGTVSEFDERVDLGDVIGARSAYYTIMSTLKGPPEVPEWMYPMIPLNPGEMQERIDGANAKGFSFYLEEAERFARLGDPTRVSISCDSAYNCASSTRVGKRALGDWNGIIERERERLLGVTRTAVMKRKAGDLLTQRFGASAVDTLPRLKPV